MAVCEMNVRQSIKKSHLIALNDKEYLGKQSYRKHGRGQHQPQAGSFGNLQSMASVSYYRRHAGVQEKYTVSD